MSIPRGIRNCNPFNIRISSQAWAGKVPKDLNTDGAFEQFRYMEYGIRAGMKLIKNYINVHGIDTIRGIINRFAPTSENDTQSYINAVAKSMGVDKDVPLAADKKTITGIAGAIIRHENGGMWGISEEQINRAWEML